MTNSRITNQFALLKSLGISAVGCALAHAESLDARTACAEAHPTKSEHLWGFQQSRINSETRIKTVTRSDEAAKKVFFFAASSLRVTVFIRNSSLIRISGIRTSEFRGSP